MSPPVGIAPLPPQATTQARMQPPVGAPTPAQMSLLDMLRIWLQLRISIPHG